MRNLFLLLSRFYSVFVFLILEIFCFYLIIKNNHVHRSTFITSSNFLTGSFYNNASNVTQYFNLRSINDSLILENQKLSTHIQYLTQVTAKDLKSISYEKSEFIDTAKYEYNFIAAKVINNSTNKLSNFITIDKGQKHGLEKRTGVISSRGVIGIMRDVSNNFATVISILHKDIKISAKIAGNDYFGSIVWNGLDYRKVQLEDIPAHVDIKKGNRVITTGYSSFFPEGILIGTISSFNPAKGGSFYTIEVNLGTDMKELQYAYVILYKNKEEKIKLEKKTNEK